MQHKGDERENTDRLLLQYINWIDALGKMYYVRYYVNVVDGSYINIVNSENCYDAIQIANSFSDDVADYAEKNVYEDDRNEFYSKCQIGYVKSVLSKERKSYHFEYRKIDEEKGYRWVRVSIILADMLEDGSLHHFVYTAQYIDEEKEEEEIVESALGLMKDSYYRIACIDLNNNSMKTVVIANDEIGDMKRFQEDYKSEIMGFADNYVLPEFRERFLNLMMPDKMISLLDKGSKYADIVYKRLEKGKVCWVRTELIPMKGYGINNRRVMWYVKNISKEKALEKKLSQKLMMTNTDVNLRLEAILNGISGGFKISRKDKKFTYEFVSEDAAAIQGYSVNEFMEATNGNAVDNIYQPDLEEALRKIEDDLKKGNTYSVKYRVKCKDGKLKWILDSGKQVIDEKGRILQYSLYQDINEAEEKSIELKNALVMLNQMVSALSCGILAYGLPNREILIINKEARRIFNLKDEDNISELYFTNFINDYIIKEDLEEIEYAAKKLKMPGDDTAYTFRIDYGKGLITIQAYSKLLQFDDGRKFILSSLFDITEKERLNMLLRRERKQYRDALMTNCEFDFGFDLTNGYIENEFVTKRGFNLIEKLNLKLPVKFDELMYRWVKLIRPQFINKNMRNLLRQEELIKRFENGERNVEIEYRNDLTKEFTRVQALLSKNEDSGHIYAFIIASDTTEARKNEEKTKKALIDAYDAANRANRAKSDFLSRMSHDIRTPMNAIIGMTAIAAKHIEDKNRVTDCLNKVSSSSEHLLTLINEVLDMSKIESGRLELTEENINLSDLIDKLLDVVKPQLNKKNQMLTVFVQNVENEDIIGDSLHIQQVFINIMGNAIKYTPDGGTIRFTIKEKATNLKDVGCYEFIFEDNGIGMSEEFLTRIFEPFARENESKDNTIQGTGLGLSIVANLVKMMGGDIKAESRKGKGSRFTVKIYLKLRNVGREEYKDLHNLSILVVDDEEDVCRSTCSMLKNMGMQSEYVLTGNEAVKRIEQGHNEKRDYFAVILDWKMPGLNGIETAEMIRKIVKDEETSIILTAYDWSEVENEARQAGVNSFISKPLFKSRLAYLFNEIISGDTEKKNTDFSETEKMELKNKRILLVEDNEINMEIAAEMLSVTGAEIESAWNGKDAFDLLLEKEPYYFDIILMDVQMPIMNGHETARAIRAAEREDLKKIPIIALTANAFADDVQEAIAAGMNQHIAKPLDFKQLMSTIKKLIG